MSRNKPFSRVIPKFAGGDMATVKTELFPVTHSYTGVDGNEPGWAGLVQFTVTSKDIPDGYKSSVMSCERERPAGWHEDLAGQQFR